MLWIERGVFAFRYSVHQNPLVGMAKFDVTQRKVNALLEELRTWETGEPQNTLEELASKYGLDKFVIDRIVRSEGLRVKPANWELVPVEAPKASDPDASTLDLDPEAIDEALKKPETNPNYKDRDTGVWKKKPTGEWQRIGPGDSEED